MKNTIKILNKFKIKYAIINNKIYLENETLDLSNNNIDGCLDVSVIGNLKCLNCSNNHLTDIICNDSLEYLYCIYNKLTIYIINKFCTSESNDKNYRMINLSNNKVNFKI